MVSGPSLLKVITVLYTLSLTASIPVTLASRFRLCTLSRHRLVARQGVLSVRKGVLSQSLSDKYTRVVSLHFCRRP